MENERSKLFSRSLSTLQEYDGEDWSSSSLSSDGDSSNKVLVLPGSSSQLSAHVFQVALLEHLCSLYVEDPIESRQLFKTLCKQLTGMDMMNPLSPMDELASVRRQYKIVFSKMMQSAMQTIKQTIPTNLSERVNIFYEPRMGVAVRGPSWTEFTNMHTSRYSGEFLELCKLGKGAYGSVFKVRHLLDGIEYAVKKVAFQGSSPEIVHKILREVRYLASIAHPNVVRYCNAWIECQRSSKLYHSHSSSKLPALTYHNDGHKGNMMTYDDSGGIIFDHSTAEFNMDLGEESEEDDLLPPNHQSSCPIPTLVLHIQMELCMTTLKDFLHKRNQRCDSDSIYDCVDEAVCDRILQQLLKGLHYLHSFGLIHRDIKPKNIFISFDIDGKLHIKLGDLGLTRPVENQADSPLTPHPGAKYNFHSSITHHSHQAASFKSNYASAKSKVCSISEEQAGHKSANDKICELSCDTKRNDSEDKCHLRSESDKKGGGDKHDINGKKGSTCADKTESNGPLYPEGQHSFSSNGYGDVGGEDMYTTGVGTTIYAAPEQLSSATYNSKCDMYSVGLVMYELYQPFTTEMERVHVLTQLREGKLPEGFTHQWPVRTGVIKQLLSLQADERPSAADLLQGELFHTKQQIIVKLQETIVEKDAKIEELEKLLKMKEDEILHLKKNRSRPPSFCDI